MITEVFSLSELDDLKKYVNRCRNCGLCEKRNSVVFGEGNPEAKIMFIGEGPGADEDRTGRPFVGRAGQLLTKMLESIDIDRNDVYIANIVKCRPPYNRVPMDSEAEACLPYLRKQVALINPKIIVCLGATSGRYIIDKDLRITRDRGKWYEKGRFLFIATFHPSALLRDPTKKRDSWEDLKTIKSKLESLNE